MADIRFIYAPIGAGKTLFSVMEICRELERSDRYIVTNIPLILNDAPKGYNTVQEWCNEHIKRPINVAARVAVLTKEQSLFHWRYLPAWGLTEEEIKQWGLKIVHNDIEHAQCSVAVIPERADVVAGTLTNFDVRHRRTGLFRQGCHYFIDEVHVLYGSRNFQKISPDLENYQSQLRKFDDDHTLISQHPEKADKNCRRNATEWLQVQNMSKTPLWLGVTIGGNRFRFYHYVQNAMPDKHDKPDVSGWYRFDKKKRFHELYFTMQGVGVSGGLVSESQRFKGRSPLVWVGCLVALVVFCWFAPRMVQGVIQHVASATIGGAMKGAQKGLGLADAPPASSPVPPVPAQALEPRPVRSAPLPVREHGADYTGQLYCKGVVRVGDNFRVILSDGRIAYSENNEVQAYGSRFVRVFGLPPIPVKL